MQKITKADRKVGQEFFDSLSDKELSKRLDLIRKQKEVAFYSLNTEVLDELDKTEQQIIKARVKKV
ncbi:MAG: hypothetical protein WC119_00870 [Synergistaceae bacterium]